LPNATIGETIIGDPLEPTSNIFSNYILFDENSNFIASQQSANRILLINITTC